jgi:hypothetical protein
LPAVLGALALNTGPSIYAAVMYVVHNGAP